MPGGPGQGTENLTGVLDATVHDPARSGPGVRLAHGITRPRENDDVGRQPTPFSRLQGVTGRDKKTSPRWSYFWVEVVGEGMAGMPAAALG